MQDLKVAIVEDEKEYQDMFSEYVRRYAKEQGLNISLSIFSDGLDITEEYEPGWDVLLLDIRMKHQDGMKAARLIRERDKQVVIMFITTLAQYAINGYEVGAVDYILKPIAYEQFAVRFKRAIKSLSKKNDRSLILPYENGKERVVVSDILYIDVIKHTLQIHVQTGNDSTRIYQKRGTIAAMERELSDDGFFKCDQSVIVNLRHISRIESNLLYIGDTPLPVSRSRKKAFLEAFAEYAG